MKLDAFLIVRRKLKVPFKSWVASLLLKINTVFLEDLIQEVIDLMQKLVVKVFGYVWSMQATMIFSSHESVFYIYYIYIYRLEQSYVYS